MYQRLPLLHNYPSSVSIASSEHGTLRSPREPHDLPYSFDSDGGPFGHPLIIFNAQGTSQSPNRPLNRAQGTSSSPTTLHIAQNLMVSLQQATYIENLMVSLQQATHIENLMVSPWSQQSQGTLRSPTNSLSMTRNLIVSHELFSDGLALRNLLVSPWLNTWVGNLMISQGTSQSPIGHLRCQDHQCREPHHLSIITISRTRNCDVFLYHLW